MRIGGATQRGRRPFKKFLTLGENNESMVEFVFRHLITLDLSSVLQHVTLFFTHGTECHKIFIDSSTNLLKIEDIPELHSNHEEADTRLLLHAQHASATHATKVRIRSPDTDVFVLMLAHQPEIASRLVFETGSGNNRKVIDINEVADLLGVRLCKALIGFHAFTGL